VDGVTHAECGLLQLACNEVETKRIARLLEQEWPEHLLRFVDAAQATRLAGVEMKYGGLWFPAGGWIVPPKLCVKLASHVHITQRLVHEVETLNKMESGWRVSGKDAQGTAWEKEADVVLVCCAHSAKKFSLFANFPLTPVRGQITAAPRTAASKVLQSIVSGDGYCAPAFDGVHIVGATHAFDDESTEVRLTDHAENLANLAEYAPALHQVITGPLSLKGVEDKDLSQLSGRASIRCSAPGSMPLVGKVQKGLYCSLAHGTRGLLTAGLAAEVLASQICGQLPPLPSTILDALAPLPRVRNKG
jgi:tRNA 5-methylaminomethyl-2-thiouridine biosynthesis bifunctional protein